MRMIMVKNAVECWIGTAAAAAVVVVVVVACLLKIGMKEKAEIYCSSQMKNVVVDQEIL